MIERISTGRSAAEEAAWDGTGPGAVGAGLPTAPLTYLAWQQQLSTAYTTYGGARAGAYFTSATDIANKTYGNAQYSANRKAQQVGTLAGDEHAFATWLTLRVFNYRDTSGG